MKTVVQINSVANKGSTGRICQGIGELATEKGWKHFLAYGRESNPTNLQLYRIGSKLDNYLHTAQSMFFDAQGLGSERSTRRLCDWLETISPNLVHLHNLHGHYINYPVLLEFLKNKRTPIVWTLHDCWTYTGHCTYYSDISCVKWKSECADCPKTANYPKSLFLDRSSRNFNLKKKLFSTVKNLHLVTVSDWLREEVSQSFLSEVDVRTIHNGVDTNVFHTDYKIDVLDQKYELTGKWIAMAAATSWNPTKGLYDYITLSKYLDKDEMIVLIGLEKNQIAMLPPNMLGISRTENQAELALWYNRANVVLNLSTQETFGMTTVEGFACGTPSIVYDATASPELINDKVGFVVEPGDLKAVYSRMQGLKRTSDTISQACVTHANQNFNLRTQYSMYLDLYESLL